MHDLSRKVLEAVISMRCDIGWVINASRHPDLVLRKLCRDVVTLWSSPHHEAVPQVLICDPALQQTQELLRALRRRGGLCFTRVIESASLEVIASLTTAGVGVGILPRNVAMSYKLQAVPHAPTYHDELFLAYRAENRGVPAIRAIARAAVTATG